MSLVGHMEKEMVRYGRELIRAEKGSKSWNYYCGCKDALVMALSTWRTARARGETVGADDKDNLAAGLAIQLEPKQTD